MTFLDFCLSMTRSMKDKFFLMIALVAFLLTAVAAQQTDSAKPPKVRVSQAVILSLLSHRVNPEYPDEAKADGISGTVTMRLEIDTEGHVAQADVLSGHPLFVQPAIDAVKQWQFKPFTLHGEPAEVETTAALYFGLPQKLRVSQGVMAGNLVRKVDPHYPEEAKAKHIRGDVILQATISKEGKMIRLTPVQGDPLLAQAAMEAVQQWEYKPYLLNGNPVEVETTVTVRFRM